MVVTSTQISGGTLTGEAQVRPSDERDKTLHFLSFAEVLNSTKIAWTQPFVGAGRQGFVWFVIGAGRSLIL